MPSLRIAGPSSSRSWQTREPGFEDVKVTYEMNPTLPDQLHLKQLALPQWGRMKAFTILGLWGVDGQTTPSFVPDAMSSGVCVVCMSLLCNSAYILEKRFWLSISRPCRVLKKRTYNDCELAESQLELLAQMYLSHGARNCVAAA